MATRTNNDSGHGAPSQDDVVRIDATGVAHPVGKVAQDALIRRQGSTLEIVPSPRHVVLMRRVGDNEERNLWMSGEITRAGRLLDVCTMVGQSRWSGELAVTSTTATRTVFLKEGNVIGAHSTAHRERLGEMLCQYGEMTEQQVEHAVRAVGVDQRFGDAAVRLGFITRETLFRFLHRQAEQIVFEAMGVARGTFTFREELDEGQLMFPLSMSLQELLLEGVRRMDEMEFFRTRIPSVQHTVVRVDGKEVSPDHETYDAYLAVNGTRTVEEIAISTGLETFEATRLVFQLIQAGAVALRPPRTSGPEGVVGTFNQAIALILAETNRYKGASQDIRASLASFAASGVVYAPIFRGAGPAEDGTLDVQKVLENLGRMNDLEEPLSSLSEWLYEYASFAMFIAEPVLRAGAQSDATEVSSKVASLLAPLAPEM